MRSTELADLVRLDEDGPLADVAYHLADRISFHFGGVYT